MSKIELSEALKEIAQLPQGKPLRIDDTMRIYDPKNGIWWKYYVQFEKDCQPLLLWAEMEKNNEQD